MPEMPINLALASNLAYYMKRRGFTQKRLAEKCGVAQTTISLYLHPERRKEGKDGKQGSAKLTEVQMLADALGVQPWQMLRPMTETEREAYERIEQAFRALKPNTADKTSVEAR